MTNKEKAEEICMNIQPPYTDFIYQNYKTAIEMSEWKDKQFAEEKKQWIDKAAGYIYTHAHVTTFGDIRLDKCSTTQFIEDFKQAMEGNNDGFLD